MSTVAEKSRVKHLQAAADCAARAESGPAPSVVQRYFRHVATEDLLPRDPADLYGAVVSHVELASTRPLGTAAVSVFNPTVEAEGWRSEHTVVQIVTDDMPFLVDSVNAAVAASGRAEHLLVHPVLIVQIGRAHV